MSSAEIEGYNQHGPWEGLKEQLTLHFLSIVSHVPLRCLKVSNYYVTTSNKNASFSFFIVSDTWGFYIFKNIKTAQIQGSREPPGNLLSVHTTSNLLRPCLEPRLPQPSFPPTAPCGLPLRIFLTFQEGHFSGGGSSFSPGLNTPLRCP